MAKPLEITRDETFNSTPITLDGRAFPGCSFENCDLIFSGPDFDLSEAKVSEATNRLIPKGDAQATLAAIGRLYATPFRGLAEDLARRVSEGSMDRPKSSEAQR